MALGESFKCYLTDLGSSNGTWLNRARLRPFIDVECQEGDVVAFGEPGMAMRIAPGVSDRLGLAVERALPLLPPLQVLTINLC